MLGKDKHGAKPGSDVPHKAGINGEPLDVAFVATVEEDGTQTVGAHPVIGVDQVPLRECREISKAEVVESLLEISGLIPVLLLLLPLLSLGGFS